MNKIDSMILLATKGHLNQYRKGLPGKPTKIPYLNHSMAVLNLAQRWGINDEEMLATCVGHDLYEDTQITPEEVTTTAGSQVAIWIKQLSFITEETDPIVRAQLKADYMGTFLTKPIEVVIIKFADRIANTLDFLNTDRYYARKYWGKALALRNIITELMPKIEKRFPEDGIVIGENILNAKDDVDNALERGWAHYA